MNVSFNIFIFSLLTFELSYLRAAKQYSGLLKRLVMFIFSAKLNFYIPAI